MLYNDKDTFNREFPKNYSVEDIKSDLGIRGRHRLITYSGSTKTYRVDNTGFTFSVTTV